MHAFGPLLLHVAGWGGEGVEGVGSRGGSFHSLSALYLSGHPPLTGYSLVFSDQNTFFDAAHEPDIVAICRMVPGPCGSLFRLVRTCLVMFVSRQPRLCPLILVFTLVTDRCLGLRQRRVRSPRIM